jgi:hypothetical protein
MVARLEERQRAMAGVLFGRLIGYHREQRGSTCLRFPCQDA